MRKSFSSGASKGSIVARERRAKAAAREADIDRVAALERTLVSMHDTAFPEAERTILPPPGDLDPGPIQAALETAAGIAELAAAAGGGEVPPVAADPEPIDRYELMREHRRRARADIPFWSIREQIAAARAADAKAEIAAEAETKLRSEECEREQRRLDGLWSQLQTTRSRVADEIVLAIAAEKKRRAEERASEQSALDDEWRRLNANDPAVTLGVLEQALADNEAPATVVDCDGDRVMVAMQFAAPEEIIPERKPAHTPTGKRTLKKRTKTEINSLYLDALGSNVLATVKEAFAVAPGTEIIRVLVVRREMDGTHTGELTAIFAGEFDRAGYARRKRSASARKGAEPGG